MKKTLLTLILILTIGFICRSQTTRFFQFKQDCAMNTADTLFVVATANQSLIDSILIDLAKPLNLRTRHIHGNVTGGNGGFNHNGSHWFLWHFIPTQWMFVEVSIEVCDVCPNDIAVLPSDTMEYCGWLSRPVAEVTNPLGINENPFEKEIILYPNPAKDKLNLKWNNSNNISVIIYNSIGQELSTVFLSKQNETIDITNLQNGLYFLKIMNGSKVGINKLVVEK